MKTKQTREKTRIKMSKLLLFGDYIICALLILFFVACEIVDYVTYVNLLATCPELASAYASPIDIGTLGIVLTAWIAQLGLSSGAYYFMAKSDHSIEIPAQIIKELPKELQSQVDPTQVIVAAITTKN